MILAYIIEMGNMVDDGLSSSQTSWTLSYKIRKDVKDEE